jgi:thiol-disulfide isomerase/thioredoxin
MHEQSKLRLTLCLSSLAIALSTIAATSARTSAAPDRAIVPANLYAVKPGNVGGPLAKQLQGKPVVVEIYASWCPACKNIAPTLSQLKKDYAGKAHFVILDISDRSKASQAERRARELGLGQFFAANKSQTGMVAIVDPATGNILTQHRNNANLTDYTSAIDSAMSQR